MKTTTKGIVIREQTVGESDRLVTLLTADFGIVKAFVRRANNIKNKNVSSTSLFAYADFSLYKGKDAYVIDNASPIEVFFNLRWILNASRLHSILPSLHITWARRSSRLPKCCASF